MLEPDAPEPFTADGSLGFDDSFVSFLALPAVSDDSDDAAVFSPVDRSPPDLDFLPWSVA